MSERSLLLPEAWKCFAADIRLRTSETLTDLPGWTDSLLADLGTATQVRDLRDRWRLFKFRQHRDTCSLRATPTELVREALVSRLLMAMRGGARFSELAPLVGVSRRTAERIIAANLLVSERDTDAYRALESAAQRLSGTLLACLGQPLEESFDTAPRDHGGVGRSRTRTGERCAVRELLPTSPRVFVPQQ
ncbi:MAG: hypothetical protein MUD17_09040 [Gemmatimonadaceae bacterium]|jgi:hypothetical protein|nr:hypothetical protein [Gemmatimonadaceae bacterium]